MKIFATSDIHDNKALIYIIRRIIEKQNRSKQNRIHWGLSKLLIRIATCLCLNQNKKEKLRQICELLKMMDIPMYMLIGNDNPISDEDWGRILDDYGVFNFEFEKS